MAVKTINISLPKDLVKEVDTRAKKQYSTRSDFIRRSIVNQLKAEGVEVADQEVIAAARKILKKYKQDFENLSKR